jgi:hypothetical protein
MRTGPTVRSTILVLLMATVACMGKPRHVGLSSKPVKASPILMEVIPRSGSSIEVRLTNNSSDEVWITTPQPHASVWIVGDFQKKHRPESTSLVPFTDGGTFKVLPGRSSSESLDMNGLLDFENVVDADYDSFLRYDPSTLVSFAKLEGWRAPTICVADSQLLLVRVRGGTVIDVRLKP